MNVVYERCCGIDVHKKKVVACLLTEKGKEIREYGTLTDDILAMREWLRENGCQIVAMESTGVYWKPIYNILEEQGLEIIVGNAQHMKAVPGRKTDVKDAEWIADLTRHGLVRASYIPSREERELREITRYRQALVEERARELNRIQAVLEGANIKLSSVVTDINGKTSMKILQALSAGNTAPEALSALAEGSLVKKTEQLKRALRGSVGQHQMDMIAYQSRHIEYLSKEIAALDETIKKKTERYEQQIALLDEIPGIGRRTAERILAETGVNMQQFPSASHFTSWAGLAPSSNESAGKRKNTSIRKGNVHLKAVMVEAAMSAIRNKKSFWYARFSKIAPRRGGKKAVVAVARSMLVAIYHMLKNMEHFHDLSADYYQSINADKIIARNVKSLAALGYQVQLTPMTL